MGEAERRGSQAAAARASRAESRSRLASRAAAARAATPKARACASASNPGTYAGRRTRRAAAPIDEPVSLVPQMARTASHVRAWNGWYVSGLIAEVWVMARPPATAAKKADTQNTIRRVTFTLRPWVASMV